MTKHILISRSERSYRTTTCLTLAPTPRYHHQPGSKKGIGWQQLSDVDFDSITHVVHLAGANIAQQRWSKSFKQTIYNKRSDTLTQLSLYLHSAKQLQQVIMCSGSSVYGLFDSDHADWTESKALAQDDRFLPDGSKGLKNMP